MGGSLVIESAKEAAFLAAPLINNGGHAGAERIITNMGIIETIL